MSQLRVLIVDDSRVIRLILKDMLTEAGLTEVSEAEDGNTAVRVFRENRPNLVLLDLHFPGIGGDEIARQMLTENPYLKIVVISAESSESETVRNLISLGISDFIGKPLRKEVVMNVLSRIMREIGSMTKREIGIPTQFELLNRSDLGNLLLEYSPAISSHRVAETVLNMARNFDDVALFSSPGSVIHDAISSRPNVRYIGEVGTIVSGGITSIARHEPGKTLLMLFDNITDLVLRFGFQTCYNMLKEMIKVVAKEGISAIYMLVPESLEDKQLATVRSLFSNRASVSEKA